MRFEISIQESQNHRTTERSCDLCIPLRRTRGACTSVLRPRARVVNILNSQTTGCPTGAPPVHRGRGLVSHAHRIMPLCSLLSASRPRPVRRRPCTVHRARRAGATHRPSPRRPRARAVSGVVERGAAQSSSSCSGSECICVCEPRTSAELGLVRIRVRVRVRVRNRVRVRVRGPRSCAPARCSSREDLARAPGITVTPVGRHNPARAPGPRRGTLAARGAPRPRRPAWGDMGSYGGK